MTITSTNPSTLQNKHSPHTSMMRILYTIGIQLYAFSIRIATPFNHKASLMVKGWKDSWKKNALDTTNTLQKTAWFHASSMGEFEQTRPLLEAFRATHADYRIVVTFFSPSGYEPRKNYPHADVISYLPIDSPSNAKRLVKLVNPNIVFFAKYDFWYNYLNELRQNAIPTYLFSATFRPSQYFFKWYGTWFLKQIKNCFTHIFVQDPSSLELLQLNNIKQSHIANDTRFDRVYAIAQEAKTFPEIETFLTKEAKTIVVGSSWEPDEERLQQFRNAHKDLSIKFIIAPHIISPSHIENIENLFGKDYCIKYSDAKKSFSKGDLCYSTKQVMIIDNIGMLSSIYRYADIAYIGGGWGKGIHNILEAVTYGKPVIFGPKYYKFNEAHAIIKTGGGASYCKQNQLNEILNTWLTDSTIYQDASSKCILYIQNNLGGTNTILKHVI